MPGGATKGERLVSSARKKHERQPLKHARARRRRGKEVVPASPLLVERHAR